MLCVTFELSLGAYKGLEGFEYYYFIREETYKNHLKLGKKPIEK